MGTGKTSAGRELARKKKWHFADLDELIELRQRRTIPEIFAKEGEPYFRKIETQILKEVVSQKKFVVACGGGIVINPYNINKMKETGVVICLKARPEVILKRTSSYDKRPLLNVPEPKEKIKELLKVRAGFYAKADYSIDTSGLSIKEVSAKIEKLIK